LWYAHRRTDVDLWDNPWWARLGISGVLASGVLWGCVTFVFSPLDESHLLFTALVISGMCAGAATVHAAHFPSVVAFIIPAIAPLAANFFIQGNRLHIVAGFMACIFGISLCIASLIFRQWFRDTTSARLALAHQASETNDANTRLAAEIASHHATAAKLQHVQKMEAVGNLAAGIAHDFNNLLMAIRGSADLILTHRGSASTRLSPITTIMQSVEKGATLTRQLLAFARRQTLIPQAVDINEVVRGIEELLITTLGGYARLEFRLDPAPTPAFVDTVELEHAIINLVINARDALPNVGLITIETATVDPNAVDTMAENLTGGLVMISVSDTGTGMSETVRLRAFDPFFTTKEFGKGSGLGLSQVYGFAKQSGGDARIESWLGKGTTVSIYLPKVSIQAVAPDSTGRSFSGRPLVTSIYSASHEKRRILLVDDDKLVLETVAGVLRSAGYTVVPFATALQALDDVNGPYPIDLIIVDFAMPDMRGDQFAAKARLHRSAVPILFISGYADQAPLQSEPFVLRKPFSAAAMIALTEQAMHIAAWQLPLSR
jgi:signal transduction histidine kinase